jgi:hypothetical protein
MVGIDHSAYNVRISSAEIRYNTTAAAILEIATSLFNHFTIHKYILVYGFI